MDEVVEDGDSEQNAARRSPDPLRECNALQDQLSWRSRQNSCDVMSGTGSMGVSWGYRGRRCSGRAFGF